MRDGRKVGTWPVAEVDQRRIAHLMTGLDIEHAVVARDMSAAEPLLDVDAAVAPRRVRRRQLHAAPRRGARHRRPARLRPHRARAHAVRHEPRRGRPRSCSRAASSSLGSNRDAVRAGIAYVSEDRLSLGVVLPQSIEDNVILAVMKRLTGRLGLMPPSRRRALAADWVEPARHQGPRPRPPGADALRRQPAAGGAGEVARHPPEGADPRQPDRRRRHQEQAGHLRGRRRARAATASASS